MWLELCFDCITAVIGRGQVTGGSEGPMQERLCERAKGKCPLVGGREASQVVRAGSALRVPTDGQGKMCVRGWSRG